MDERDDYDDPDLAPRSSPLAPGVAVFLILAAGILVLAAWLYRFRAG